MIDSEALKCKMIYKKFISTDKIVLQHKKNVVTYWRCFR